MKTVTLKCAECGEVKTFAGNNSDEILDAMDKAEWVLGPDMCPTCWKKQPEPTGHPE